MSTATFPRADLAPVEQGLARYHRDTAGRQIAEDIDLAPSNVSRRISSALRPDRLLDAFTGRQVLLMIAGDARRGGDLLERLLRMARGGREGDVDAAPASARELERRSIDLAHAILEAQRDGIFSADEAADITAKYRLMAMFAEGGALADLDAVHESDR